MGQIFFPVVQLVPFLFSSSILSISLVPNLPMTLKAREANVNTVDWLKFTERLWPQMVSKVSTEVSSSLLLVSSSTEASISVFMTHSNQSFFHQMPDSLLHSPSVTPSQSLHHQPLTQLTQSDDE